MPFNITTDALIEIDYDLTSTWTTAGAPLVSISGQNIPKNILIQQILSPSSINITDELVSATVLHVNVTLGL